MQSLKTTGAGNLMPAKNIPMMTWASRKLYGKIPNVYDK